MAEENERETPAEDQGYRLPLPEGPRKPLFPKEIKAKIPNEEGLVRVEYLKGMMRGEIKRINMRFALPLLKSGAIRIL